MRCLRLSSRRRRSVGRSLFICYSHVQKVLPSWLNPNLLHPGEMVVLVVVVANDGDDDDNDDGDDDGLQERV